MFRPLSQAMFAVCLTAALGMATGCQRPFGQSPGGYSAPGAMTPAGSQTLFPIGPIQGATRVPPPSTGSSQVSNGYAGRPSMLSHADSGMGAGHLAAASSNSRSTMGGMPVIDLTAGLNDSRPFQAATHPQTHLAGPHDGFAHVDGHGPAVVTAGGDMPIGSGVAPAAWAEPIGISVPPSDLASRLRPLEGDEGTRIMPPANTAGYVESSTASVAMAQYRTENAFVPMTAASGGAEQSTQAFQPRDTSANYASASPEPSFPSTEPVNGSAGRTLQANPNDNLLWRNPSVAR